MRVDDSELLEFIQLYKDEFGEHISLEEARVVATGLLELYETLIKPLPEETDSFATIIGDHSTLD
jgi:hypothetical protein